jgi:maleylpyruvate isomerase
MNDLHRDIAGATRAHRVVIAALVGLDDEQVRQPSVLPGWTVGHVVTHIARNAEGHLRMLEAAGRGECAAMYPGGLEQRTHDIEAGSARTANELSADVSLTVAALEAMWDALSTVGWSGRGKTISGPVSMSDLPFIRWREVAVHHADLGIGYSWADWDTDYVRLELARSTMLWASRKPMGMTELPPQALAVTPNQRVAWLLGRTEIDGLEPAGITS